MKRYQINLFYQVKNLTQMILFKAQIIISIHQHQHPNQTKKLRCLTNVKEIFLITLIHYKKILLIKKIHTQKNKALKSSTKMKV